MSVGSGSGLGAGADEDAAESCAVGVDERLRVLGGLLGLLLVFGLLLRLAGALGE